jgi:pimeloyl-ACP methyl ester carboxylesterase
VSQRTGKLEGEWVTVNGLPVFARVSVDPAPPDAPAVVLVHGLIVSSRYMVPTALRLAPFFRVYALDLPGFGQSGKPKHALNVPELADALAAWMQVIGLDRAVLLGNSFGTQIIATFAVRHQERLERAVLVGPTILPRERMNLVLLLFRWLKDGIHEPPSLIPILLHDYLAAGARRAFLTFLYMLLNHIEDNLPLMPMPTLVVRGSLDPVCDEEWAEEVTRLLPMGELVVIPGAPHAVNYAAPKGLVQAVRAFLRQHCPNEP